MEATFSKDKDFCLPKPDFQNRPPARTKWLIIAVVVLLASSLVGKMIYNNYHASKSKQSDPSPSVSATPPAQTVLEEEVGTDVNVEVNESVSSDASFKEKNNAKTESNIQAVKKRLEEVKKNPTALVKPRTYQEVHAPSGIYHLVVVSHLRKDLAMKSVQRLIGENWGVYLIVPRKGERYYRVTIAHSKTRYEAEKKLKKLKGKYKNLFILNY
ncbi:MAG TPA: hypothetical protein VK133_00890 [Amoebophilaceae bacterium]|jgi:flagellar basal body-associated protein FliL|nr:hypothetical protein [Amoebophilaceae bacterium]